MKKSISFLLVILLLFSSAVAAMSSFTEQRTFSGQFADVADNAWYKPYVEKTYELGLVNGTSTNRFSPDSSITIAQTIALAARIHATYSEREIPTSGGTWYAPYVQYAVENGMIDSSLLNEAGLDALEINRLSFAWILVNALPVDEFQAINTVAEDAIPDLQMSTDGAFAVYAMYEAGILTGNDAYGTFTPYSTITRAEVAAVVSRMVDPSLRQAFTLQDIPRLTGFEGNYFVSAGDVNRPWIGYELNVLEISGGRIRFDFQHPKAGHAIKFTSEDAKITNATTAVGYGTCFYVDQPENTTPVKYEFIFSNYNIHLNVYIDGAGIPDYTIDYACGGAIQSS